LILKLEAGIEPAASSLGNRTAIENKTHRVHGGLSESIESPVISDFDMNIALTRQKCGRNISFMKIASSTLNHNAASHLQSRLDEAPRPFARRNSNPAFQSKDGGNVFFIFPASSVVPSPPSANPGSLSADRFLDLRLSFSPFNRDRNMI
jgi:hypothetical protein